MSETRKLTLEIEVPAEQVPKNATGLKYAFPHIGDYVICAGGLSVGKWAGETGGWTTEKLIIETREPWRVPEHLRHPRYNGWIILIHDDGHIVTRPRDTNGWTVAYRDRSLADAGRTMGLHSSDFDGMEPGVVYQLGERGNEQQR